MLILIKIFEIGPVIWVNCLILVEGRGKTYTVLIEDARKKYGPNESPLKNFDPERDGSIDERSNLFIYIVYKEDLSVSSLSMLYNTFLNTNHMLFQNIQNKHYA